MPASLLLLLLLLPLMPFPLLLLLLLLQENNTLMGSLQGKERRQVAQALHKELSSSSNLLLQLSRCLLLLFSADPAARSRLQPLALDCIRSAAAVAAAAVAAAATDAAVIVVEY